jgi:DNA-binding transcriptional regulator YdaS (Cro superfamily)
MKINLLIEVKCDNNKAKLARMAGVHPTYIGKIILGRQKLGERIASKIAAATGTVAVLRNGVFSFERMSAVKKRKRGAI